MDFGCEETLGLRKSLTPLAAENSVAVDAAASAAAAAASILHRPWKRGSEGRSPMHFLGWGEKEEGRNKIRNGSIEQKIRQFEIGKKFEF